MAEMTSPGGWARMARASALSIRERIDGLAITLHSGPLREATETQRVDVSRQLEMILLHLGWVQLDLEHIMGDDNDDKPAF